MSRSDKTLASQFRERGLSYGEIHRALGIPKSTLATWFKDLRLPLEVQNQLASKTRRLSAQNLIARNKRQTILAQERAENVRSAAAHDIGTLNQRDLLVVGAALYWAEGGKRPGRGGYRIAFSNSDPEAIRTIMRFFREICLVPDSKFRIQIATHPGVDVLGACEFWSRITEIPLPQFIKTFVGISRASSGKRPRNRLPNGTCQIRVNDTAKFHQIMGWIAGLQQRGV